jgi:tyrosyl-tRNA synthetase
VTFPDAPQFAAAWTGGELHPQDLKTAVAAALDRILAPARRYFAAHPELSPASFQAPAAPGAAS